MTVNTLQKLMLLRNYYERTTQSGHTHVMLHGALHAPGVVILTGIADQEYLFKEMARQADVASYHTLHKLRDMNKPLALDNSAVVELLDEVIGEITALSAAKQIPRKSLLVEHEGFEIKVWRAPSLGGDELLYYTVVRKADGWFLVDSFSTGSDTLEDLAGYLKERVDAYLADPTSECDEHPANNTCSACKSLASPVAEDLVYVPGDWVCPKCSLRIHKRFLNAADMSVGINDSAPAEPCPNDGTSMQRLTWKQDAEEANRLALDLVKENRRLRERIEELEPCH